MLLERVRETIERHDMLRPGDTVLVAVSGGIDSVVLLDVLRRLAAELELSLHVAHLDHGLRDASADDARFVERLATEWSLPYHASRLDPETLVAHHKHGREGAAREARYAYLRSAARHIGADRIALGHTANDQAETILQRLARGTGIAGLQGIAPVRRSLIRPLLHVTRTEVQTYAHDRGLPWRVDESNADLSYARNRIRHRILPELETINPRAIDAILRAASHAVAADEVATFLVSAEWSAVCEDEAEGRLTLRRTALAAYPPAVRSLLLREAARRIRGDLTGLALPHIDKAKDLITQQAAHGELSLPGVHVRVQGDEIRFSRSAEPVTEPWSIPVDVGDTTIAEPPMRLRLEIVDDPPTVPSENRWRETADADRVAFPLELRSRRDGDRFAPFGLGTEIKLKDFLINEHVPYFDRDRLPLLCDRERIVWAVGVRLSDEVRITEGTRRYLTMEAHR